MVLIEKLLCSCHRCCSPSTDEPAAAPAAPAMKFNIPAATPGRFNIPRAGPAVSAPAAPPVEAAVPGTYESMHEAMLGYMASCGLRLSLADVCDWED